MIKENWMKTLSVSFFPRRFDILSLVFSLPPQINNEEWMSDFYLILINKLFLSLFTNKKRKRMNALISNKIWKQYGEAKREIFADINSLDLMRKEFSTWKAIRQYR